MSSARSVVFGLILLGFGSLFFLVFVFTAIVSRLLPPSNYVVVRAIQNDWYYCFLVPMTLPIVVVPVYFHWLSMKLFKHA